MKAVFSQHALFEMKRRKITKSMVTNLVKAPQQEIRSRKERLVVQGKYFDRLENRNMLLRVIGKVSGKKFFVITCYKTSKIKKYWQKER